MDVRKILSMVDHTLLSVTATESELYELCDDAVNLGCASVCISPTNVRRCKEYVKNKIKICTVIGFPNGYNTTAVKCTEASDAVKNGADEIDMVINLGFVKEKKYNEILNEINSVKAACNGRLLKVIVETCLLNEEEKIKLCEIVSESDADFIKTSTGFSTGGATKEDIALFSKHVSNNTFIKAAGGISSLEDAELFIKLGASRLGTSRIVRIVKNENSNSGY